MLRRNITFHDHPNVPFSEKNITFVSYRHKDHNIQKIVVDHLKEIANIALWVDNQLSIGENYDDEIREAIQLSDILVQIVTENYLDEESYTMSREIPMARDAGLIVVAILCDNASEETVSYVQENADYVCSLQDTEELFHIFNEIKKTMENADFRANFMKLTKRIDSSYLTPKGYVSVGIWLFRTEGAT